MPIASMTGFGKANASLLTGSVTVELRSVNNRYIDIQIRTPRTFSALDSKIKKLISGKLKRGSVVASISWVRDMEDDCIAWDTKSVDKYMAVFNEIRKKYAIEKKVTIDNLLNFSDFITRTVPSFSDTLLWRKIKPVVDAAIDDHILSRQREASIILRDMKKMLKVIEKAIGQIEKRAPLRLKKRKESFESKLKALVDGNVESGRLAMEVTIIADKLDIQEECTRTRAHLEKIQKDLACGGEIGKRLGFILQELNREANTIASKANDTIISHLTVVLKENIEKLREQSLNLE